MRGRPARPANCPECGAPIPPDSRTGACVSCLLGFAVETEEAEPVREFGKYRLEEKIGRGGMGVVYRARHGKVDRTVALKMIVGGELASREAMRRFRVETEAAANLSHPNIVPIHDVGEVDGLPYYTMRFVDGGDLASAMADFLPGDSRDKQDDVARFLLAVTKAVAHAHEHGVLHRDLKPTNILLDQNGEPLLTDFGLAKRMQNEQSAITLSSSALGSPAYMAPEQTTGEATTASDVWSLGAILYEMLVGEPPFRGKTAMETLRNVVEKQPDLPRRTNPRLSRDLETICLKCLEKEPHRRYRSAAALAGDLERFLRHEPVEARPVRNFVHVWRWCRRNPLPASLAVAFCVAVFFGIVGVTSQWMRAETANVGLSKNVRHLEWQRIRSLEEQDESGQALANLAAGLRKNPGDSLAASYALSLLQTRRFPLPQGRRFSVPGEEKIQDLSFDNSGRWIAGHAGGVVAWIHDGHDGSLRHTLALPSAATSLAMDGEGKVVAVGSADGFVHFFDPTSGEPEAEPWECDGSPTSLVYLPGRRLVAAVGNRLIESDSQRILFEAAGPIRFLLRDGPGRRLLATTDDDATLLDALTGEKVGEVALEGRPRETLLSDDGSVFAVQSERSVSLFDDDGNALAGPFGGEKFDESIRGMAISANAKIFAAGGFSGGIRRWSLPSGSPMSGEVGHEVWNPTLAFGKESGEMLSGGADGNARLWNLTAALPVSERMYHQHLVGAVWFLEETEEGSRILTAEKSIVGAWNYFLWTIPGHADREVLAENGKDSFDSTAISPDGKWIAIGARDRGTWVVDRDGNEILSFAEPYHPAGLHFSADSDTLFVVGGDGTLSAFSVPDGANLSKHESIGFRILASNLSANRDLVAVGSPTGSTGVWDIADPAAPHILWTKEGDSFVVEALPSPDGDRLLAVHNSGEATVRELRTGELLFRIQAHQNKILDAAYSPDGSVFATGTYDSAARLWDAETGRSVSPPLLHRGHVTCVAFSSDSTILATGSRDGSIKLWDPRTGEQLADPMQENSQIRWIGFSKDGTHLGCLSHLGMRLWEVATGEPATTVRPHGAVSGVGAQGSSFHSFLQSEDLLLVGVNTSEVALWNIAPRAGQAPDWFPSALEAVAMQRIGPDGVEALPFDEAAERLRDITRSGNKEEESEWSTAIRKALGLQR